MVVLAHEHGVAQILDRADGGIATSVIIGQDLANEGRRARLGRHAFQPVVIAIG